MLEVVDEPHFLLLSSGFFKFPEEGGETKKNEVFRGLFGVETTVCNIVWKHVAHCQKKIKPVHLIWALFFLRHYGCEKINAQIFNITEKTYQKWVWLIVELLLKIDVVSVFVGMLTHISYYCNLPFFSLR